MENGSLRKVLIIEDDASCLRNMEIILLRYCKEGYEIAANGPTEIIGQALKAIQVHQPDIILLDMNFGGKIEHGKSADGYRVAERLSPETRGKIICTSGEPGIYENILRPLGVNHFGGKFHFHECILGGCDCNKTAG